VAIDNNANMIGNARLAPEKTTTIVLFFLKAALLSSALGWDAPASHQQQSRENEIA